MSSGGNTDSGRVLRELSAGRFRQSRRPLAPASASQQNRAPSETSGNDLPTVSSIDPNDENLMMSTRHNFDDDSHLLPKLRSTAQNYRYYNPPEPQQHVPTSAVNRAFQDFDDAPSSDGDDDDSIEVGRGLGRNTRGTPSKLGSSDIIMQLGNSFYAVDNTPPAKGRASARKSDVQERSSLHRNAVRRASGMNQKEAQAGAKASPRAAPGSIKSTRFRSVSKDPGDTTSFGRAASEPPLDHHDSMSATPNRPMAGTPRSAGHFNTTAQSFMLPDISNLTELLGGTGELRQVTSRSAKARSRFTSGTPRRGNNQPNFVPVEQVPVPGDAQALAKALEVLKEKVFELEKNKEEAANKMADYENEIFELRTELHVQQNLRKTDSALGASDEEGNARTKWRVEKTSKFGRVRKHEAI
jgi:hypothetical protein